MTTEPLTLPVAVTIAKLIADLTANTVKAHLMVTDWTKLKQTARCAELKYPSGELAAVLLCDLAFCAFSGASLMAFPAPVAQACIKAGDLDQPLRENFAEIANVLTGAFREFDQRVILGAIHVGLAKLPPECAALLQSKRKAQFELEFARYGLGRCAFLLR
jgi:hypothetical protein